jgi:ABC-type Fe3+/spermidine/putrescine transport system ATPase subunit
VSGDGGACALRLRDVSVERQGRSILDVPELGVRHGETLAIVGPNGSGKSTLLRVLGLLESPSLGEVWFGEERVTRDPHRLLALRRRLAIVFQDALLCRTSVANNVGLGLRLRGTRRRERRRRVQEWLDRFGIAALARRNAHRVSGGEAQRVSLARAFALQPEILLLDEPFAAVDPPTRETLAGELQLLLAETRTTTVFVTHDRDEAFALGDRVAVLLDGRIAQIGRAEDVARRPSSERIARFLGIESILPGQVVDGDPGRATIEASGLRIRSTSSLPRGASVWCCIRAEDVTLRPAELDPVSPEPENSIAGVIRTVTTWGTQARIAVDCGPVVTAITPKRTATEQGFAAGTRVRLDFSADAVHVVPRAE